MSKRRKAAEVETYEEILEDHEEELENEAKKGERKMKAKKVFKTIGIAGAIALASGIGGYLFGNRKQYSNSDAEDEDDRDYVEINPVDEPTPDAD